MKISAKTVSVSSRFGRQVYQVAYVIVKAANSPRPGNWILERSVDGATYRPWQYYAMSDSECWSRYGVRPTIGIPRFTREDEVLCTAQYSKLNPLENGEVGKILFTVKRKIMTGRFEKLSVLTKCLKQDVG